MYISYGQGLLGWQSTPYEKTSGRIILTTGASDAFKKQNIYDLAGNVFEWTGMRGATKAQQRGGSYMYDGTSRPADHIRATDTPGSGLDGFRVALYKDEGTSENNAPTYIPSGYTHVEGTDMDSGYVVEDRLGNQYVWVEVPQSSAIYTTAGTNITNFTDAEFAKIENDLNTYTSAYDEMPTGYIHSDEWLAEKSSGLTKSEYNMLKKKMLKSIYKNGGFYVGRYATGIENTYRSALSAELQTPVIKKDVYTYNFVSTPQAQNLASKFKSTGYETSLMFGVQWNLILKYLENNGTSQEQLKVNSTSWGNYGDSTYNITNANAKYNIYDTTNGVFSEWKSAPYQKTTVGAAVMLTTGASDEFKKQNIYDLAGNTSEITLEQRKRNSDGYISTVSRSGTFASSYNASDIDRISAAQEWGYDTVWSNPADSGFRVTLYKDEGIGTTSAYIPEGYTQVSGTNLDNGLVIQDGVGNQYVWVPVPRTTEVYKTAGLNIESFTNAEYAAIEADLNAYTSAYGNASYIDEWSSEEITGLTQAEYNTLKKKMLKSVYINGGFYVGRYETGIDYSQGPRTGRTQALVDPIIKQNAYPYNSITTAQAQVLSSRFATTGYETSLMFGLQWDLIQKHLELSGEVSLEQLKTDSTSWGNFKNSTYNTNASSKRSTDGVSWTDGAYNKTADGRSILTTGASDTFKKQNIYDLAGNMVERTLERASWALYPTYNGGSCYWSGTERWTDYRGWDSSGQVNGYFGFRVALYKDEGLSLVREYDANNLNGNGATGTSTTTIKDLAGIQNGTIYGNPTFGNGYISLNENGSTTPQYIDMGPIRDVSAMTINLKFSVSEVGTTMYLVNNQDTAGISLGVDPDGTLVWSIYREDGSKYEHLHSTTIIEPNTIYDVTAVYDGMNSYIYINGVLDGTLETIGGNIKNPAEIVNMFIGGNPSSNPDDSDRLDYANNVGKMKVYSAKIYTSPAKKETTLREFDASNLDGNGATGTAKTTIKDLSGHNDGTIYKTPTFASGYIALNQGSTTVQYIDVGQTTNVSQVKVNLKFSVSQVGTFQHLFGNWEGGGYGFAVDTNKKIQFYIYRASGTDYERTYSTTTIQANTIYDATGIYDGKYLYLYIDGVLQQKLETGGGYIKNPNNSTHLVIGANPSPSGVSTSEYAKMKLYKAKVSIPAGVTSTSGNTTLPTIAKTTSADEKSSTLLAAVPGKTSTALTSGEGTETTETATIHYERGLLNPKYRPKWSVAGTSYDSVRKTFNVNLMGTTEYTTQTASYTGQTTNQSYVKDGLIRYFDAKQNTANGHSNTTTIWKDLSGNNNGQLNGGTWSEEYLALDGVDDWVNLGQVDLTTTVTLEATITLDAIQAGNGYILGNHQQGGFAIQLIDGYLTTNVYIQGIGYVAVTSDTICTVGKKYHVVVTYDGSSVKLYVNGELKGETAASGPINPPTNNTILAIGVNPKANQAVSEYGNANIYQAKVYSRALSYAEVLQNYTDSNSKGLVRDFNAANNTGTGHSNTATTWKDLTGNHNGTLHGGTWSEQYLTLDGTDDWVNLGQVNLTAGVTLETTIELNSIQSADKYILGNVESGGATLYIIDGKPGLMVHTSGSYKNAQDNTVLTTGKKYHLVGTYDGEKLRLYLDGKLVASTAASGPITVPANNTVMALGTNPAGNTDGDIFANVKIYSARVYDKAITENEIKQNTMSSKGLGVTSNLESRDISVYVDDTEITPNIIKTVAQGTTTTVDGKTQITHAITFSNFEQVLRQIGKLYKEWSGNITLKIGGRGEKESTYKANVLVDSYGNQSMMETDEVDGTWIDINFKDAIQSTANTEGKLFADFINPEIVYKYTNSDINYEAKTVQLVFTIADKYYSAATSTGLTAEDLEIFVDGVSPVDTNGNFALSRELTSTDITATINGVSKTIGKQYTLTISEMTHDTGKAYLEYGGIVSVAIPAGKIADESGNKNTAQTLTVGIDFSQNTTPDTSIPYIPTGFTQVEGTDLSNGFTVQDALGNQYVWVEVPQTILVYQTAGLQITQFTDEEYTKIENDLHEYTSVYRNGTTFTDTWSSESVTGLNENEYNTLKKKMLKSIYRNGGFYVGKYETGINYNEGPRTELKETSQAPVIKANAYTYNFVTSAQAQQLASGFKTNGYETSLMFGVQWDLMLKYLENSKAVTQDEILTDSGKWGNYLHSAYNITNTNAKYAKYSSSSSKWIWNDGALGEKASGTKVLLSTGADDRTSKQNIYDIAGNEYEFTLENTQTAENPVSTRGGHFYQEHVAGRRGVAEANYGSVYGGFRVVLYRDDGIGAAESRYTWPYLPTGYTKLENTSLDNGLVIVDSNGNEYVWVEVPRSKEVYKTAGVDITGFSSEELTAIEQDLQTYTQEYRVPGYSDTWQSKEQSGMSSSTQYDALKNKMLKSVYLNGGFYVGRYETGSTTARTSGTAGTITTPVIQPNAYNYNWVSTLQAQNASESFAPTGYTGSLMFGVQWDLIMKYLETKGTAKDDLATDSTAWGNYAANTFNITNPNSKYYVMGEGWKDELYGEKAAGTEVQLSSGASDLFKKQNIYDLAGNVLERTLEYSGIPSNPGVARGGSYGSDTGPANMRRDNVGSGVNLSYGFRVALYKNGAATSSELINTNAPVIVDLVDPKWTVEVGDESGGTVGIKLRAIDEYFARTTLTIDDITVYVNGIANSVITKDISTVAPVDITDTVDGVPNTVIGKEYTLLIGNLDAGVVEYVEPFTPKNPIVGGTATYRKENAGDISIDIAAGTIIDTSGNRNDILEDVEIGNYDFTPPEIYEVSNTKDTTNKTATIIFNVTDKNYDPSDKITAEEITILVDGVDETDSVNIQSLTDVEIITTVDGVEKVVGHQYTLVLNEIDETDVEYKASGRDYRELSGTISIEIDPEAAKDSNVNYINPDTTDVPGPYVDFIPPELKYEYATDVVRVNPTTGKKEYVMTFTITDKNWATGVLTTYDIQNGKIEVLMQNGQRDGSGNPIVYNLKDEPVSLILSAEPITKTINKTVNGEVVIGGTQTVGHTYTLTISDLDQFERKTGMSTVDYSGIVTVSIDGGMIKDTQGNSNTAETITTGVDIFGDELHTTPTTVDIVNPLWEKISATALAKQPTDAVNATATTGKSTIEVKGTDTYFYVDNPGITTDDSYSKLTADEIEVYVDGVKDESITPVVGTAITLTETRKVYNSATTETVQYGVRYTITVNGWAQGAKQVKIRILPNAIKDKSGNGNIATDLMIYNCLESAATEGSSPGGGPSFLDGNGFKINGEPEDGPSPGIKRGQIKQVIFVDSLAGATGAEKVWDVGAIADGSIKAWTSDTSAPYTVYIGSDDEIYANQDSSRLFYYIGRNVETEEETILNIEALNVASVTNMSYMFNHCGYTAMTTLNLGDEFDTSNVTNMREMFGNCGYTAMESLTLPASFDTSNVTEMVSMFSGCGYTAMESLTLPASFDTSNVPHMSSMFANCGYTAMTSLTLPASFDTSNVTNMRGMFSNCGYTAMESLTLPASFDTSNVTNMISMFSGCGYTAMTGLTLPDSFDTSNVTNMSNMFSGCGYTAMTSLTLPDSFDTSNVTDMTSMFRSCGYTAMTSLTLPSSFNTSSVPSMSYMFEYCGATAMTSLDLGPAFTKISSSNNTNFITGTGKEGQCVIYAPEAIYKSRTALKFGATDTTATPTGLSYARGTINPKYKPEWTVTGTTVTNTATEQKIDITLLGKVDPTIYTSNVTSSLTEDDITIWIDGTEIDVDKDITPATASGTTVTHTLTLTDFAEAVRRSGLKYTEWSGNITLRIGGRGEATSTYTANTLKDDYGNQSMMATDEVDGTWIDVTFSTESTNENENDKLFTDFIKPEFTYEYAETTIGDGNHGNTKILTVVFYVADKYFDATNSTGITLADFYNPGAHASSDGKPVFQIAGEAININVEGNSLTGEALPDGTGIKYTLVVKNLEQTNAEGFSDGYTHSGVVSITIPADKFQDYSGNKNAAKTFTIGIDDPTTGDGHNTAVKVDVVDPIWEIGDVDVEAGTIKLRAEDKYFDSVTIDNDDITVYVDGNPVDTNVVTIDITSTTPTDIRKTVDGVANTLVGKEYTLKLSNLTPGTVEYTIFEPTNLNSLDEPTRGTYQYKYKTENGGEITVEISAGTAKDKSGNTNKVTTVNAGSLDVTPPGIYEVRKTQNASGNTETIVFNVTDRNFSTESTNKIEKSEMSIWMDDTKIDDLLTNATLSDPVEIKAMVGGEERVVGHQYTLVINNIAETTKRDPKAYLEWSGTLRLEINAGAAKDIAGNNSDAGTITDFIDYIKPQLEPVTVTNPINTSDKTYTMSFNIYDKYLETELFDASKIKVYIDGELDGDTDRDGVLEAGETPTITKTLTNSPIEVGSTKKTVGGVVTTGTQTIGQTYTLVLSGFEQASKQTGKDFMEWSGTVKIVIDADAVQDTTGNTLDTDVTNRTVNGEHVDFIKPVLEEVTPTAAIIAEDATNKTETIVFNIMDKYLDTTNALETSEITVYVDGEAVTVDYTNSSSTGLNGVFTKVQDFKYTVNDDANHVVGQQYKLVLSGFEQLSRNAKNYKDYSGTVSIELAANAVNDTSNNLLDSSLRTVTGDFVDYTKPDIQYTHQDSDVDTGNKKYTMTFDITDKYYSTGVLTLDDITGSDPKIEILMQNGQKDGSGNPIVYNLKDEPVTIALSSTPIEKTFNKTVSGTVVTEQEHTIGHTYTLTISNLEQLERKTGMTTAAYSGIIDVSIDGEMIKDTSNNGNSAKTITSGVDIPGGTIPDDVVEVDVVDPLWERVSSTALAKTPEQEENRNATTGTSTITIKGTDTYFATTANGFTTDDSTLTSDEIEVYVDGVKNILLTPSISAATLLEEERRVYNSATNETVQYGVQYTITLNGWKQSANQVKIRILEDAIKDETGNGNKETDLIIYNCLEATGTEYNEVSGFLDGNGKGESEATTGIRRNQIQQVIFVDSLAGSTAAGVQKVWDVSAISDGSIKAWTSQTSAPYTVYIGSDFEIFANQTSDHLFQWIGYAGTDGSYYTPTETETIKNLELLNTSSVTSMTSMFEMTGYTAMTNLTLPTSFDTSNVIYMVRMFFKCGYTAMTSLTLPNSFDTSNVEYMGSMFNACGYTVMTSLTLPNSFDTSNVGDMNAMFNSCGYVSMTSLTLPTSFDTSNVTNMSNMFYQCGYTAMTSLNLGNNFDTSNVTDMSGMFQGTGYTAMTSLTLPTSFDTSSVTDMEWMFMSCGSEAMTSLNLGNNFDTSNVTDMSCMFWSCGKTAMTSLDLGNLFDTSNVTDMTNMFRDCGKTAMTVLDLGPAFTKIPSNNSNMFTNCGTSNLKVYAPESIYSDRTSLKLNN